MNTDNLKIVFDQYIEQFDYLNAKDGHDEVTSGELRAALLSIGI